MDRGQGGLQRSVTLSIPFRLFPSLFGASLNPATLSRCLRTLGDLVRRGGVTSLVLQMVPLIVQIWARSGFDRIEEFLGYLKDYQEKIPFELEGEASELEMMRALGTRLDLSTAYHPQTDGKSERTIQAMEDMLRACVIHFGGSWDTHLPLVEFSYNNSYYTSIKCALFKVLYGRKCRSPLCWLEARDRQLTRLDIIQEMEEDLVLLKVSPWKGLIRFGKRGKLNLTYIGPFKILERVGAVAYRLELPQELSGEIQIMDKLQFVKEPLEIIDHEVWRLKHSQIPIVKVRWNSRRGLEYTWECEDEIKRKYSHMFANTTPIG
ncbi:putative reverse transcriptase domain-containing protein [Tanacetum coccineum]